MKKQLLILIITGIICLPAAQMLNAQVTWDKHDGNPVLEVGADGSWDDQMVGHPSVLIDGTTYRMWYAGQDGTHNRIGHATSPDGITWTKDAQNPVLDLGPAGSWDDYTVMFPTVVFNGSMFHMWYDGWDGGTIYLIGHATSPDGITWTKDTLNNPVLDVGPAGSWDDDVLFSPFVRFDDTIYHMWYSASDHSNVRIGHATSPDGITWTKDSLNPVLDVGWWDRPRVQSQCVINNGSTYHMWYSGGGLFTWRIGHATSPDGITWTKDTPNNLVLDVGSAESWDDYHVSLPSVLFDAATSTYMMWYMGGFEAWQGNIGYATSAPTGIDDNFPKDLPQRFALSQNYPNPFNPVTTIQYELPQRSDVTLTIYDITGRLIETLVDQKQNVGRYSIQWDASQYSTGVYFYKIQVNDPANGGADGFSAVKKCLLIK